MPRFKINSFGSTMRIRSVRHQSVADVKKSRVSSYRRRGWNHLDGTDVKKFFLFSKIAG